MKFLAASTPPSRGSWRNVDRPRRPNPYFKGRPIAAQEPKHAGRFFGVLIALVMIVVGTYFFAFGPAFAIKDVQYQTDDAYLKTSLEGAAGAERKEKRFWIFPEDNLLAFSMTALEQRLRAGEARGYLDELHIEKVFPHTLRLAATKRQTGLYTISNVGAYDISKDGHVITTVDLKTLGIKEFTSSTVLQDVSEVTTSTLSRPRSRVVKDLPYQIDPNQTNDVVPFVFIPEERIIGPGDSFIPPGDAEVVQSLFTRLRQSLGIKVKTLAWDRNPAQSVTVFTWNGPTIYFDPQDIGPSFARLNSIWTSQDTKKRASIEYIDLRFAERVFIKRK